ncbi:hypothetical protein BT96DRAFT_949997 [Gymnopus androsaceus JB14]|uniref:ATP-dependent DNA helicase n=1 Tax=Gymnopus androsaceus JB14 TaxID=1447944 RepID=A0A6A4GIG7_9AGAR|nr:hypothetical protein BT96DRAFT_949997 [Gymnopus androsaceus JB14]
MCLQWMQEAARGPNSAMDNTVAHDLGQCDMDLLYDWHEHSPYVKTIRDASHWLADQIKESPNDDIQILPPASYCTLKGPQRTLFLQVMAYFKKLLENPEVLPPPLYINVDGTAGTGKTYLIQAITHALHDLLSITEGDPVVWLAPTGVAAFGIHGWTLDYGVTIPIRDGKDGFVPLGSHGAQRIQI